MNMKRQSSFSLIIFVGLCLCLFGCTADDPSSSLSTVKACRAAGFDPYQLACKTCDLLPAAVQDKCRECCIAYKTLEKSVRRHQAAVLTFPVKKPSYFPELNSLVTEDWDGLIELKGKERIILKDTSDSPVSPSILWFDKIPKNVDSIDVSELEKLASSSVNLYGWKRDDAREMLKSIVQDQ